MPNIMQGDPVLLEVDKTGMECAIIGLNRY